MRPIRHSLSILRWGLLFALASAAASGTARAQYFDYAFDYGTGYGTAVSPSQIYGDVPNYDYVTPSQVYGYGGIDFGYGYPALASGDYFGVTASPVYGYGYGYQSFGSRDPFVGAAVANPVPDEGQNATGTKSRVKEKKATRRPQPQTTKRPGTEDARKGG